MEQSPGGDQGCDRPDGHKEFDLESFFRERLSAAMEAETPLNIMLVGRAGVGKSTLVNAIFDEQIAPTGIGAAVTKQVHRYVHDDVPVAVYDTPGIEHGADARQVASYYLSEIKKQLTDEDTRIDFALYCVKSSDRRFEPSFEGEIVKALAKEVLVVLVLTQCPTPGDPRSLKFADHLISLELPILDGRPFLTLAEEDAVAGMVLAPFGLAELVSAIYPRLPEAKRHTLASYQRVSLELNLAEAKRVVRSTAGQAALIAATPIPLLDAIPISGLQIYMLGKITSTMGFKIDPKAIATALAAVLGIATGARTVASFFKIFPGVGSVINAGIASSMTMALGEAYIAGCEEMIKRQMGGEVIAQEDTLREIIKELPVLRRMRFA